MSNSNLIRTVRRASRAVDTKNPELAFKLSQLARSIRIAAKQDVKLESWDDFVSWWNQNRSQGLLFSLIDALGDQNPVIGLLKQIMSEQDALERKLHDAYMQLKGGSPAPEADMTETLEEPAPAAEEPAEEAEAPAAEEDGADLLEDVLKD